jgi:hypothetical protein
MKTEFDEYLKKIGISELFYERSKQVIEGVAKFIGEGILDIFVSDYIDNEGKRHYEDLLLFTEHIIVEAKQFLTQDHYFINNVKECPMTGIDFSAQEYGFETATTKSRISVRVYCGTVLIVPMKAAQENCDYLNVIFKKYFLQTLAKSCVK